MDIEKFARAVTEMLDEAIEIKRQRDNLLFSLKEIISITDRNHYAWHGAKKAIADAEGE